MADSNDTSPIRLLVVDSDVGEARRTSARCQQLGFEVFTANRCDDALEMYLKRLPQAVLVELVFPDGTGLELIREIRTYDWSHATVILLHTVVRGALEVVEGDARRAGANAVVPKPLSTRALATHIGLPDSTPPEPDDLDVPPPTDWDAKPIMLGFGSAPTDKMTRGDWDAPTALNAKPLQPMPGREEYAQRLADTKLREPSTKNMEQAAAAGDAKRGQTVAYPDHFRPEDSGESDSLYPEESPEDVLGVDDDWPTPVRAAPASEDDEPDDGLAGIDLPYPSITDQDVLLGLSQSGTVGSDQDDPLALLDREEDIGSLGGLLGLTSNGELRGLGAPVRTGGQASSVATRPPHQVEPRHAAVGADLAEVVREGELTDGALVDILAAVAREQWFGRVRIESGHLWTEMAFSEGYLWSVACDAQGASLVDVGYRHGLLPASALRTLRDNLTNERERDADAILLEHGLSVEALERLFALTATERIINACEFRDGHYRCAADAGPDPGTFEPRLPVDSLVATALDRHYPVMRAVDRYADRESQRIRLTERFESFPRDALGDDFSRAALASLEGDASILEWVQANPANPGALFLLLTKLELLGAVEVGDGGDEEARFSFRGPESGFEGVGSQSRTMPATPSELELARVEARPTDGEPPPAKSAGNGSGSSDHLRVSIETRPISVVRAGATLADCPEPAASAEPAGTDDEPLVPWVPDHPEALWRKSLYVALDRWDWRQASSALEGRLNDEPDDVEAGSYDAWLAFARALEDDGIGDPGDAIAELEHFCDVSPTCHVPIFLLGLAALSLGNVRQAREHVDHALTIAPDDGASTAASLLVRAGYYSHPAADLAASSVWRTIRNALK